MARKYSIYRYRANADNFVNIKRFLDTHLTAFAYFCKFYTDGFLDNELTITVVVPIPCADYYLESNEDGSEIELGDDWYDSDEYEIPEEKVTLEIIRNERRLFNEFFYKMSELNERLKDEIGYVERNSNFFY